MILISGSGAHDRDAETYGFSLLRLIAERLAECGIASLRWDDRGVGLSTGSTLDATTDELAGDVLSALRTLRQRLDILSSCIGLLGYSAGGSVAVTAAVRDEVAGVVLLGCPALQGEKLLLAQGEKTIRSAYSDPGLIEDAMQLLRDTFAASRGKLPWHTVERALEESIVRDTGMPILEAKLHALEGLELAKTRWYRHFLDDEVLPCLMKLSAPVLALFAEYDWHVEPQKNSNAMRAAFRIGGNHSVQMKTYPRANHLFVSCSTGDPAEYADIPKLPVARLFEDIGFWAMDRLGVRK
jgi:pimeloyl-ACP methyl ester carboxylesterase